uniref:LIM domain 7a n=1 Tax=Oreochromis aureus TaxID=47969 RepID=A0AAZ1WWW8_OREAU
MMLLYSRKKPKHYTGPKLLFFLTGGSESAISDLQVPSLSPPSSSWSWDLEEDRRRQEKWQEEQERLLQEKYQRDQERLEAEWRRAQKDAVDPKKSGNQKTFAMTPGDVSLARTQQQEIATPKKSRAEQSADGEKLKELSGPTWQSNAQGVQNEKVAQQDWTKSLSFPVLAGPHKYSRGDQSKRKGLSVSKAEKERQQILEEMKKRTQLVTDNSWIRQRSSSFYKDPMIVGLPLKSAWAAVNISEEERMEPRFESETGSPSVNAAISNSGSPPCEQLAVLQIEE